MDVHYEAWLTIETYLRVCTRHVARGRILGRNWDKNFNSYPPCYSQSPLLTDLTPPPLLSKNGMKLVCNVNIAYEISSLKTLKIMPRNRNKIVHSWIRLLDTVLLQCSKSKLWAEQKNSRLKKGNFI